MRIRLGRNGVIAIVLFSVFFLILFSNSVHAASKGEYVQLVSNTAFCNPWEECKTVYQVCNPDNDSKIMPAVAYHARQGKELKKFAPSARLLNSKNVIDPGTCTTFEVTGRIPWEKVLNEKGNWTGEERAINVDNVLSYAGFDYPEYAWWNTTFLYKRLFNFTNPGTALVDFTLTFNMSTVAEVAAGKILSDCSDIRFANGTENTQLNFSLETQTCNTANTAWNVRLPAYHANPAVTSAYIYYGNTSTVFSASKWDAYDIYTTAVQRFNETTATSTHADSTYANRACTNASTALSTSDGVYGRALNLTTESLTSRCDYGIAISNLIQNNAGTISTWIRRNGALTGNGLWHYDTSGYLFGYLWLATGKFRCGLYDGGDKIAESTTSPVIGTWYHLACTWDGSNIRIYVNGVNEATTPAGSITVLTGLAHIGSNGAIISAPITVDSFTYANTTRSAAWVNATYSANHFGPSISAEESSGPIVTLNTPANSSVYARGATVTFNYTPSSGSSWVSASLWTNETGTWASVASNASTIVNASPNFIYRAFNSTVASYLFWNVRVCDTTACSFAAANMTLNITNVTITLQSPINDWNDTNNQVNTSFIFNVSPTNIGEAIRNATVLFLYPNNTLYASVTNTSTIVAGNNTISYLYPNDVNSTLNWSARIGQVEYWYYPSVNFTSNKYAYNVTAYNEETGAALTGWNYTTANSTTSTTFNGTYLPYLREAVEGTVTVSASASGYGTRSVSAGNVNSTSYIAKKIYLLSSADATLITFIVRNGAGSVVANADYAINKTISGTEYTLATGQADDNGIFAVYLHLGDTYEINVSSATCSALTNLLVSTTPYTITVSCTTDFTEGFTEGGAGNVTWWEYPASTSVYNGSRVNFTLRLKIREGLGGNITNGSITVVYQNASLAAAVYYWAGNTRDTWLYTGNVTIPNENYLALKYNYTTSGWENSTWYNQYHIYNTSSTWNTSSEAYNASLFGALQNLRAASGDRGWFSIGLIAILAAVLISAALGLGALGSGAIFIVALGALAVAGSNAVASFIPWEVFGLIVIVTVGLFYLRTGA